MCYILKKVEVNMNADQFGGRDHEKEIAISDSEAVLETYCIDTFGVPTKKKEDKFMWEYYVIINSNMIILR